MSSNKKQVTTIVIIFDLLILLSFILTFIKPVVIILVSIDLIYRIYSLTKWKKN